MVSLYTDSPVALPDELTNCPREQAVCPQPAAKPRRLIQRLIASLGLTMVAVCSVVIAFAHIHPTFTAAEDFGLAACAGVPCFRHMTPGRTSWADVQVAYSDPLPSPVTVSISADGVSVGEIYIHPRPDARITLGEIITLYGAPCRVSVAHLYGHWVLFYPLLQVESFADESLSLDKPVSDITFTDPAVPAAPCAMGTPEPNGLIIQRSWQGFTVMQRYLQALPEQ